MATHRTVLDGEHHYEIGDTGTLAIIRLEDGKPRLLLASRIDDKPVVVHVATFRDERCACAMTHFLDAMIDQINQAIVHHQPHLQEPNNG